MGNPDYSLGCVSKHDWGLHRKGPIDQARHNEKVKEAIRGHLGDIISEEAIISANGDKIVKIPIRGLELPGFRYNKGKSSHVGQGTGDSHIGDIVGVPGPVESGERPGAGEEPGIDYYEAEITIDELANLVFEDLGLPNLTKKPGEEITDPEIVFDGRSKTGSLSRLNRKQTIIANIKRHAIQGEKPKFDGLKPDDLRYKAWREEERRITNAVVFAMRDVSGSMGEFEKYISRSFYFWMVRFLRQKYQDVKTVFITHHAEAKEVPEKDFFTLGESGGTKVSSAYKLALGIIGERYNPERWNIYSFHFSDGDNWGDLDNRLCLSYVEQLLKVSQMVGYGEIQEIPHGYSTLMSAFSNIKDEKFRSIVIMDKAGVYPALRTFFNIDDNKKQYS